MGIELPGWLTEPLSWVGLIWPQADEEKLFEDGQVWISYGSTLRGQAQDANSTAQKVWTENHGESIEAFQKWWNADDGPAKNLEDEAVAAELIGAGLIVMAAITLALKIAFIVQLVILAIEVAQAIASAFATFGATTAEIPGFVAASRVICRELINKVISMVEREIAKLFEKAAQLLEKVGAKDLSKGAGKLADKIYDKAGARMLESLAARSERLGSDKVLDELLAKAERADVGSPKDGANFYSGYDVDADKSMRKYAEEATDGKTSVTLEQTPGGKEFDKLGMYNEDRSPFTREQSNQVWNRLSERYGEQAEGNVTAYVHSPRDGAIYTDKELPALIDNPNVTSVKQIDPVTGEVFYPKPPS
jgi:hypothetical protein